MGGVHDRSLPAQAPGRLGAQARAGNLFPVLGGDYPAARTAWNPARTLTARRGRLLHPGLAVRRNVTMPYVDGFIVPVPKKKVEAYRRLARKAGKIWKEYGALEFKECIADDVKKGKWTSFPRSVKLKPNETVMFSYIVYKSRKDRDRINAKVMKDSRIAGMDMKDMPFDGKRMIYGGFKVLVDA
jgi:uncharacterized protein YbaA (DUF1428 family)